MMEESDEEEAGEAVEEQGSEPNPILYVEGLPAEVTSEMLSTLFQQYVFISVLFPPRLPLTFSSSQILWTLDSQASPPRCGCRQEQRDGVRAVRLCTASWCGEGGVGWLLGGSGCADEGWVREAGGTVVAVEGKEKMYIPLVIPLVSEK